MSFLVDPPLLVGAGAAAGALSPDHTTADAARRVTVAVFLVTSISLYLERRWIAWMWKMMGSASGRDWMINSGVTHFEYRRPPLATHLTGALVFATYPLWFRLGEGLGRRIRSASGAKAVDAQVDEAGGGLVGGHAIVGHQPA
ncbi:MAG TPA: hypothetical protein VGA13_08285 [Acidimicrobiales bacterium]|jgi:hypothetical protein